MWLKFIDQGRKQVRGLGRWEVRLPGFPACGCPRWAPDPEFVPGLPAALECQGSAPCSPGGATAVGAPPGAPEASRVGEGGPRVPAARIRKRFPERLKGLVLSSRRRYAAAGDPTLVRPLRSCVGWAAAGGRGQ